MNLFYGESGFYLFAVVAYPWAPLKLLREEYVSATDSLTVLLISMLLAIFITAVTSLLYAYNEYLKVFALGTAVNAPRVLLYFILVPLYGGFGAALSYFAGSIVGFVAAAVLSKNIGFNLEYKTLFYLTAVSVAVTAMTRVLLPAQWTIGVPLIAAASYIAYLKLKIVSASEVVLILKILPFNLPSKLKPLVKIVT